MKLSSMLVGGIGLQICHVLGQATQPATHSIGPVVDLGYVKYRGTTNHTAGINYFRGIQYAYPPTASLRWQAPIPIEHHNSFNGSTIYDASAISPACYMSLPKSTYTPYNESFGASLSGYSEDCLTVDVLVPVNPMDERLAVMVQIHGGSFQSGNAQVFPGDGMVNRSEGEWIRLKVEYRLGIFGFLGGSAIEEDGVLNAGLLDQRAALEWIQRNIAAFGGDPSRVTIWGGSAGGSSVAYQLIAGGAFDQPPFSAAIAEYPWFQQLLNQSEQQIQYSNVLQLSGCSSITCLRGLPVGELENLNQAVQNASVNGPGNGYGQGIYNPVVDGSFVKELPSIAFQLGHFHDVPLIVDRDAYEGVIFSDPTSTTQAEETTDAQHMFPFAGPAFFSRLYQLYPKSSFNSTFFQRQTWFGDYLINCPTYVMGFNAIERNSNRSAIWKMVFSAGTQLHGATQNFLNSATTDFPTANNQTLVEIMTSYWISFAVTHDPNTMRVKDAAYWPGYASGGNGTGANGESAGFTVQAVTYSSVGPEEDPDVSERCEFFGAHAYKVQN
ncbi:uncharacterized protein LTR77_001394 [Saxophila tyrrhenica]|uniref:Carboxylic ester hydrolase n=1 Tax=Saxophila tyrrhenica TaxID=1690608 RepID=A0AAV9PLD8_9PEZI|nr:hypothetical protein LTR77_001394 [Saxophila tyrrhenica]